MLKFLIESGQFKGNIDALFARVIQFGNSIEVLKFVIDEYNIDPHKDIYSEKYGIDVIFDSMHTGHLDIIKYIVEKYGFKINGDDVNNAVVEGKLNFVKYYIEECNYDVHENDDYILTSAITGGCIDIVEYLINEHDINLGKMNFRDFCFGEFMSSCVTNSLDRAIYLIEKYNCDIHDLNRTKRYKYQIFKNKKFINYLLTKPLNLSELHYKLRKKFKKKFDLVIKEGLYDFIINDLSNIVCKYI
jgi:hypothetical protein